MTATQIVPDVPVLKEDTFLLPHLIRMAAEYKNVELHHSDEEEWMSKPLATSILNDPLLVFLDRRGIRERTSSDRRGKALVLVDENRQKKKQDRPPSNRWTLPLNGPTGKPLPPDYQLRIELRLRFSLSRREDGVALWPLAQGIFMNPFDELPNFRMFKALVESGRLEVPPIAEEVARSRKRHIVVTWANIGVHGIRRISQLFQDFTHGNKLIEQLARSGINPFESKSFSQLVTANAELELFVAKHAQPALLIAWQEQLARFYHELNR